MGRAALWDRLTFGAARRRRWMRRRLAELDRQASAPSGSDGAARGRSGRERDPLGELTGRQSRIGPREIVVLGLVVVLASAAVPVARMLLRSAGVPVNDDVMSGVFSSQGPPVGVEEAARPLNRPRTGPPGRGGYRFLLQDQGKPVSYDPCRPLHYVIRSHGEPKQLRDAVGQAVSALEAATGLHLVFDGTTTEPPADDREAYQPSRYGRRWAPLLIAFSDPAETPHLAGDVIGDGGSTAATPPAADGGLSRPDVRMTYVSGQVRLDTPQLLQLDADQRQAVASAVTEHELGHVVGLDHVDDDRELMYPQTRDQKGYGPGDLRGLALLGAGGCQPGL